MATEPNTPAGPLTDKDVEQAGTVSRGAYFGGLVLGLVVVVVGFFAVSALELGILFKIPLEVGVVYLALKSVTTLWRSNARAHLQASGEGLLDPPPAGQDRREG
ncbi:hypothetical protein L6R52_05270 [Myxococcota bacterium]|nr:hypothetical protein [Myxococcota bacterium]